MLGYGAVALAAAVGGAAWRLHNLEGGGPDSPDAAFWSLAFDRPEGGRLDMAALRGQPMVLNFWATWCPPCVEEMPELDRFHQAWSPRGWQVIGLAVDGPSAVRRFLQRLPVSFPIGLACLDGATLGKALGNREGGLPFTVVLDGSGTIRHRKAGKTSLDELTRWASAL